MAAVKPVEITQHIHISHLQQRFCIFTQRISRCRSGQDYCVACAAEWNWRCPNPDCQSAHGVLEPRDFLQVRHTRPRSGQNSAAQEPSLPRAQTFNSRSDGRKSKSFLLCPRRFLHLQRSSLLHRQMAFIGPQLTALSSILDFARGSPNQQRNARFFIFFLCSIPCTPIPSIISRTPFCPAPIQS